MGTSRFFSVSAVAPISLPGKRDGSRGMQQR